MKLSTRIISYFKPPKLTYRLWKVWRRNFDVFMKTYKVNFFPPLLEPIFYLVALGFGLGTIVTHVEGVSYIQFIAPALVAVSMMYGSFFECTYGSFVRMYYQKTFDAIIATPVSVEEVIAGELLWGATRAAINSTIVLAVVAAFGLISSPLISSPLCLIVPLVAFFAGLTFSAIGMAFTAIAPNIDFFNYPGFLFITPMFLLSGTFFPFSILPSAVQTVALIFLPLTHSVAITRGLMLGALSSSILLDVAWLAVVTVVFFVLSVNLMKKRLIK
jgi:lipooligosaccharide transport system permease protein